MEEIKNIAQVQEKILRWFDCKQEGKRQFDWSQGPQLYQHLFPHFLNELEIEQLLATPQELSEKFNKFFATAFKLQILDSEEEEAYNLAEFFLFLLKGTAQVVCMPKRRFSVTSLARPGFLFRQIFCQFNRIEHDSLNSIRIRGEGLNDKPAYLIYTQRAVLDKFRIELIKQDRQKKIQFLKDYLFGGKSVNLPLNCIKIRHYRRGKQIFQEDHLVTVLYSGSVTLEIVSSPNDDAKKWKFSLVKGALLSTKPLANALNQNIHIQEMCEEMYKSDECVLIQIPFNDFARALRHNQEVGRNLTHRIKDIENSRNEVIDRILKARQSLIQEEQGKLQVRYSLVRNKNSRAFRRRHQSQDCAEYQSFMSFNKYQKMTQNKENVQKKHIMYAQLTNIIREKQKQERLKKKMRSETGIKQIKKNQYVARLKQTKIQHLAIKQSILNTEKYRNKPHDVKFIFEDDKLNECERVQLRKQTRKKWTCSTQNNSSQYFHKKTSTPIYPYNDRPMRSETSPLFLSTKQQKERSSLLQ